MLEIKNLSKNMEKYLGFKRYFFKVEKGEKLAAYRTIRQGNNLANLISNVLACEDNKIFIDKIDK